MAIPAELVERVRACVGDTSEPMTATVDKLMSQRYARAIGDTNPLYFDAEYARSRGYEDVLVPPNFLPSYLDWSDGGPQEELRPDGTPTAEMEWIPLEGVRIMGGGEEMIFHSPLVAGVEVVLKSSLDSVDSRESRSGPMIILKIRNSYVTTDGRPIVTSIRTVLGR
ncbi:MaoC family dehydratase N-terminal domain-containing protein [Streptomyces sp. NPDC058321]|uniref:FAS1-like dehydratase domain-containing protein n=1 Tax=Streptomyces sp. NPDC058321 TaxID=3346445 RepID=UPI0036E393E1